MKKISMAITLAFLNLLAFAQEKTIDANVDLNTNTGSGGGSSFPWMYLVGAILLIVVLFAIFAGRGGSDRIVERRTIIKD